MESCYPAWVSFSSCSLIEARHPGWLRGWVGGCGYGFANSRATTPPSLPIERVFHFAKDVLEIDL